MWQRGLKGSPGFLDGGVIGAGGGGFLTPSSDHIESVGVEMEKGKGLAHSRP